MIQYKGYTGVVEVDVEAGVIHGRVIGLRDVITFEADSVKGLRKEFEASVDCYLDFCKKRGEPPEKPFSGRFVVRIEPALHRAAAIAAEARGISLNAAGEQALRGAVRQIEGAAVPEKGVKAGRKMRGKAKA